MIRLDDVAVGLLDRALRRPARRHGVVPARRARLLRGAPHSARQGHGLRGPRPRAVDADGLFAGAVAESMATRGARHRAGRRRQVAPAPGVHRVGPPAARSRRGAVRRGRLRWAPGSPFAMLGRRHPPRRRHASTASRWRSRRRKLARARGPARRPRGRARVAAFLGELAARRSPTTTTRRCAPRARTRSSWATHAPRLGGLADRRVRGAARCCWCSRICTGATCATVRFVDASLRNLARRAADGAGAGAPRGGRALPGLWAERERRRRSSSAPLSSKGQRAAGARGARRRRRRGRSRASSSAPTATRSTWRS